MCAYELTKLSDHDAQEYAPEAPVDLARDPPLLRGALPGRRADLQQHARDGGKERVHTGIDEQRMPVSQLRDPEEKKGESSSFVRCGCSTTYSGRIIRLPIAPPMPAPLTATPVASARLRRNHCDGRAIYIGIEIPCEIPWNTP